MTDRIYGVVTGLVKDVRDPEEMGRIKLTFPWLAQDNPESGWAPIVRGLAGDDRGYWYMPEVDDEALVAFEQGDVNHPMVLGFLHNGQDKPPNRGIDEHVRRLKSVAGHVLEFDDRSGKEGIRLHTKAGHQLELHDADGFLELHTSNGHKLRMENTPGSIELSTPGGVTVTISDIGGVAISAPNGSVSVTSMKADLTAAQSATVTVGGSADIAVGASAAVTAGANLTLTAPVVTINSAMANFAGVVQCQTLLATSVVSSSYRPGAGNIW